MALFNHATKEVTAKVVYYGPGLSGKTTNLQWLHDKLSFKTKGRLVSLATQTDRTLFFDFLPLAPGPIRGMHTRLQVYTVPGQVLHESTRRMVLKGCDAVVFVADSQAALLDANAESLRSLRQHLLVNELDPALPQVIQYNKRDLPSALPLSVLDARLNPRHVPSFEAIAREGVGVEETLRGVTELLLERLSSDHGEPNASARRREGKGGAAPVGATLEATKPLAPETAVFEEPAAPADSPPHGEGLRADQWLYLLDGVQRGPIDVEALVDLVLTSIPEGTKVWHPGLEGWLRANQVREIADEIPPPVPGTERGRLLDLETPDFAAVPPMLRKALIADEDAAFRRYLALPLAAQGFTIDEAADGAAAWQLAVQNRPWMILADVSLPEVDGFELCCRVRRHALLSRTPVIFISGSDEYQQRYRALQIGADDFLSKTTPIRELLMRIRLLMARYSDLSAPGDGVQAWAGPMAGALGGRVELFGASALLQIFNQGNLTGTLRAKGEGDVATLGFRDGEIVSAIVGSRNGVEAVYTFLRWEKGGFEFTPGDPGPGEPLAPSVHHLLLDGCRRLDESRRDEGDGPASS